MKIVKKAALICSIVLVISIVPVFALNQTTNNIMAQVQNQPGTCDQNQVNTHCKYHKCQKNGTSKINCGKK